MVISSKKNFTISSCPKFSSHLTRLFLLHLVLQDWSCLSCPILISSHPTLVSLYKTDILPYIERWRLFHWEPPVYLRWDYLLELGRPPYFLTASWSRRHKPIIRPYRLCDGIPISNNSTLFIREIRNIALSSRIHNPFQLIWPI